MSDTKTYTRSFARGEVTPELFGRLDLTQNQTGLALCRNFVSLPYGPVENRPGTRYMLQAGKADKAVRLIPFVFNQDQAFAIELGDQYARFHSPQGTVLETATAISNVLPVSPCLVFTGVPHGLVTGDWVFIDGVVGTTQVNGRFFRVTSVSPTSFSLKDFEGGDINGTTFSAYASGGTVARVYQIATPYLSTDLFRIHYVQSNDVLTLVHPNYPQQELRRLGATNWTVTTASFTLSAPPLNQTVGPSGSGTTPYTYAVAGVLLDGQETKADEPARQGSPVTITAATLANPGVFTSASHALQTGYWVYLNVNMTPQAYYVVESAPTVNTFTLRDPKTNVILDTSAMPAFTSGTFTRAYALNNLSTAGNYNRVSWGTSAIYSRYNVYKLRNGLFGYIGSTDKAFFDDDNISADVSRTPPVQGPLFNATNEYPAAVTYYEQRKAIAGANIAPQRFHLSKPGTENNFSQSVPTRDDDAISYNLASRQQNQIKHLVPLGDLIMLTTGAEYRLFTVNSDVVTPTTINARPFSYVGCNDVQPVTTDSACFYGARTDGRVREIRYGAAQDGASSFANEDASLFAPHLFAGLSIVDMAHTRGRAPTVWAVRSDGVLLGMTYVPEQDVRAWHRHDTTAGSFESICAIPDAGRDVAMCVVRRRVNTSVGQVERRYIEKLDLSRPTSTFDPVTQALFRALSVRNNAFHVDSGLTRVGPASAEVTNLNHLEGHTVSILGDGAVFAPQIVVGGKVTLEEPVSTVHVGLPIIAQGRTLPPAVEVAPALGVGAKKVVAKVHLRLLDTSQLLVGASLDKLRLVKQRTTETYGAAPNLVSGMHEVSPEADWNKEAQVVFEQREPLPCTISAMAIEVSVGG